VRGIWAESGAIYAVGGTHAYLLSPAGSIITDFGAMAGSTGIGPCQIVPNGASAAVMDPSVSALGFFPGAIFNLAGGAATNVFGGAALTYQDGFGIAYYNGGATSGNQVFVSNFLDFTTWNGLNFVQKTGNADLLVTLEVLNGLLWMFGEKTIEVWYDAGNPTFPFSRVQGATLQMGVIGRYTVVKFFDRLMWIGADANGGSRVFMSNGITPVPVSNPGVEYLLELGCGSGVAANVPICYGYQEGGHAFYCINMANAPNYSGTLGTTLCYDLSTGLWHERNTITGGVVGQFLPQCSSALSPDQSTSALDVLVGDSTSGNIYVQSINVLTDNGAPITYIRRSPVVSETDRWTRYKSIEIDADIGTGQVQLQYSNDGGATFQHSRGPISVSNEQGNNLDNYGRFKFWQLGRSRHRVFQAIVTGASQQPRIVGAYLNAAPGNEV
jgi:hypothetical protein